MIVQIGVWVTSEKNKRMGVWFWRGDKREECSR